MKKLLIGILIVLASMAGANYIPVSMTVGDGGLKTMPDYARVDVWFNNDVWVDSLVFDPATDSTLFGMLVDSVNDATGRAGWYRLDYTFSYDGDTTMRSEIYTTEESIYKLDSIGLAIDSIIIREDIGDQVRTINGLNVDVDTLYRILGDDTLYHRLYYHFGGAEGDPPDSTETFIGGP